ncbi:6,7-dimethyl-8-ribityllumazine synthase [Azoarcus communis]|uniref:6,7-dimethyl-8-ribityllumazine synthase n=1 Tax=Parazoarcus communis SWub3 = DSM 12120 TaxID=1121029 RepID=A0A323UT83_9RHOO|nr:6,7-dimethyl-8-ribityllumazine synthase [Parazoarcus communis]NMG49725.1 6,7-dimethyl-8-ribityllumazine synthase [Parazoarcus communis]NMG72069.1 6,7-dimethyl-8-ribityllumazine synthase [Parazoarcus communis SWub3 = DSM 12120]PZA14870.1 6,7-dimethyl-8-ribityllumazine synthase [Azoarcus communis] [Parazoarcus communis SWub3 = DSM 12120]
MARFENIHEYDIDLDGKGLRVGVVMSRFNQDVCEGLLSACTDELIRLGVSPELIRIATVPGALEIPLVLQKLANSGKFDALVALGAVIRGETYHFELVSNEMGAAITRVGLDTGVPIANGVLTTEDDDQALARMQEKGSDCARAAVEMAKLLKVLP